MQRRMAQWKKIEEEALKLEQQQSRSRSSSNDRGEMSDVSNLNLLITVSHLVQELSCSLILLTARTCEYHPWSRSNIT